jgi:hypothetical protein
MTQAAGHILRKHARIGRSMFAQNTSYILSLLTLSTNQLEIKTLAQIIKQSRGLRRALQSGGHRGQDGLPDPALPNPPHVKLVLEGHARASICQHGAGTKFLSLSESGAMS